MCGIFGIFSQSHLVEQNRLVNAMQHLSHRGPDGLGLWIAPEKNIGLAHTRLAIIDIATGQQPLFNETNHIVAVVNGEFYGYKDIRKNLIAKGHRFKTQSDSEILIHLYEEMGTQCLTQLRGEFAFILWDNQKKICFAARDRFGIKPLFYSTLNNTLHLSSEIKALLAYGLPPRWDLEAIKIGASTGIQQIGQTFFRGIHQLLPGHYLISEPGGSCRIIKYWDFNFPKENEPLKINKNEIIERFRELLTDAVRVRMQADVPVASYLSGGLDSSTILGIAASLSSKPIQTFTLGFDDKHYDESAIAERMASHVGAKNIHIPINEMDLVDNFVPAIEHAETSFHNGHAIAKFILSKIVHDNGYKVVYTGEGADEILGGYAHFQLDRFSSSSNFLKKIFTNVISSLVRWRSKISYGLLLPSSHAKEIQIFEKMLGYTPTWCLLTYGISQKINELFRDDFRAEMKKVNGFESLLNNIDKDEQLKNRSPFNESLYLWSKFVLPNYQLSILGDRMEMAHSIEGRVPYLDHPLVEFVTKLPDSLKIHGLTVKYLLAETAKPYITEEIYHRKKHPFLSPPALLNIKGPFFEFTQSTLRDKKFANIPVYDQKKIITLLDKIPNMNKNQRQVYDPIIMLITSGFLLKERFKITM